MAFLNFRTKLFWNTTKYTFGHKGKKEKEKDWSAAEIQNIFCIKFYYNSTAKIHFEFTV